MIFTNQAGIGLGHTTSAAITGKVSDVVAHLGLPVQAFVASADDLYRKPATGMWAKFAADHNAGIPPDLSLSTFVGDAAGRQKGWDGLPHTRRDHSVADRKFAHNVGLRFATPEPFFLGHKEAAYKMDTLDIASFFTAAAAVRKKGGEVKEVDTDSEGEGVVVTGHTTVAKVVVEKEEKKEEGGSSSSTLVSSVTISSTTTTATVESAPPSPSSAPLPPPKHAVSHQELVLFVGSPSAGK